ncbi:unnamed protein product [Cylindrotheca closterium]|uniref:Uncharacterized protein n=1 Tax=Cylindrotheca closterium TaxID=2856 RepID=A0AAD2JMH0_9STRA|nr:unnamed protein product [Cylindrotheca closterium]
MLHDSAHFAPSNDFDVEEEKKTNDDEKDSPALIRPSHEATDNQLIDALVGPRASAASQLQSNRSKETGITSFQQQGHNSLRENGTIDSDSIYTSNNIQAKVSNHNNNNSVAMSTTSDIEQKSTPSVHSTHTNNKGGTVSLNPSVTGGEEDGGSYMSVEVIEPAMNDETPKIGQHGHKTTTPFEPIIQVVEHHNTQMVPNMMLPEMNHPQPSHARQFSNEVPKQEIIRQLSNVVPKEGGRMTPPNVVLVDEQNPKTKQNPFGSSSAANSTDDGSLYTDGHDGSTLTKDTFIKQQDVHYMEEERQAYSIIDPEAPKQEATQDYDAYYDPNAYSAGFGTSQGDEPSIGHSTITSLTKDTGILRTELPDDLPVSRGILTGEDVSYLSPPRMDYRSAAIQNKPGTPSTLQSNVVKDEEYGSGGYPKNKNQHEPRTMWAFLQNATRDPTVQCLISMACIFAVILFFLVAVIIVMTSDDIQI